MFLLIIFGIAALIVYGWMVSEFEAKAAVYDLSKIPKMESASVILLSLIHI